MTSPLRAHWLLEAVRLRESGWGPLDDAAVMRRLQAPPMSVPDALLARADALARQDGLSDAVQGWRRAALASVVILGLVALLAGAGMASAVLGDGLRPVNLLWAVIGLLGLHAVSWVLWLIGMLWASRAGAGHGAHGGVLGTVMTAIAGRLARGPAAALAPQALASLLGRERILAVSVGLLVNLWWLLALLAALAVMLSMLATRRFDFVWETTILNPDVIVSTALGLGALPAMLGFPSPDASLVQASGAVDATAGAGRAVWAGWLVGVLVVYGVLPRAVSAAVCALIARRGLRRLQVDPALPGLADAASRLVPTTRRTGVVDPAPDAVWQPHTPVVPAPATTPASVGGAIWRVSFELPAEVVPALPQGMHDGGTVDGAASREQVLAAVAQAAPARLLVMCDGRQTPDRGTAAFLAELAGLAGQTRVWPQWSAGVDRRALWRTQLAAAGVAVVNDDEATAWLAEGADNQVGQP